MKAVLVDTSTLIALNRWPESLRPRLADFDWTGVIEALVLFDRVILDGPSVQRNQDMLGWLPDMDDGTRIESLRKDEVGALYLRAATLFQQLDWKKIRLQPGGSQLAAQEFTLPMELHSVTLWSEVEAHLSEEQSWEVADAFGRPMRKALQTRFDSGPTIGLIRHFYYLALQERTGGALLLHPEKTFSGQAPRYGYAEQILGAFDRKVRKAYEDRRRAWLGDTPRHLPLPPLTRFVLQEAHQRSWNLGRTISWMREQPEVRSFRRGMRMLDDLVAAGDDQGVDAVLHELEAAAGTWAEKLGTRGGPAKRLSLQVALPFVQPAVDVSVPMPARSSAQRMLVLIARILAFD